MLARKHAALGNARISYLEKGEGAALVLLHGIGSAAESWRNQLNALSARYRVIAWDAPGYADSTAFESADPKTADYADRLIAFLAERRLERFHLLGHSLGALIAARLASDQPARIQSLTLASIATGHARLPEEERVRLRSGRTEDLSILGPRRMAEKRGPRLVSDHASDDARRAVIETMAKVRPDGYLQAIHLLSQGDTVGDAQRLPKSMPVQIVFGSDDIITPPGQNRRVASAVPQAQVHEIADAGHAVYLEQPAAFNQVLGNFLASHD